MADSSTMTTKGQVTVPKAIRRRLGLKAGDKVEFVAEGDRTLLRRANTNTHPFRKYRGIFADLPGGRRAANKWVRGLRDDKEQNH